MSLEFYMYSVISHIVTLCIYLLFIHIVLVIYLIMSVLVFHSLEPLWILTNPLSCMITLSVHATSGLSKAALKG